MQRKYTNAQALAVYQALQQSGGLSALEDDTATALYLSQNAAATGELNFTPGLLERLTKRLDKGGMVLDPFCSYDYADRRHIRNFSMSIPIPFSAFDGIRRSKHQVQLTAAQEENVLKSFSKLLNGEDTKKNGATPPAKGAREISVALPFVSAFFDQRCPELHNSVLTGSREGATYLLLSIITGHKELCAKCLKAGANPNNMSFLRDESPAPGDMFHGYSPVFMAVLAEQVDILELLCSSGGSIHVYDRWGRTPLHAAMALESTETVQWLLAKGAPLYVPDGFGILPADSCVGTQYAEYSMPMLALQESPKCPPPSYFNEAAKSWATPVPENKSKAEKGPTKDAAATSSDGSAAEGEARMEPCRCHSGRPVGFCGCIDDMLVRWARDRLSTEWSPGVNFSELAKKQAAAEEERKRTTYSAGSNRGGKS
ncbi:putative Ankyrin repeat (3 copies)/Ankyrin repeat (many copies) [Leishmania naiffi]|uniref:Ankyrin repeat (3 copies)/Ankyrin repeat (Many copies) n=1 Tax=Leishmania naiffi TaxID=5678 RepID=A0AAW3B5W9_9TRYP